MANAGVLWLRLRRDSVQADPVQGLRLPQPVGGALGALLRRAGAEVDLRADRRRPGLPGLPTGLPAEVLVAHRREDVLLRDQAPDVLGGRGGSALRRGEGERPVSAGVSGDAGARRASPLLDLPPPGRGSLLRPPPRWLVLRPRGGWPNLPRDGRPGGARATPDLQFGAGIPPQ